MEFWTITAWLALAALTVLRVSVICGAIFLVIYVAKGVRERFKMKELP